ncbi:MAG: acylglycerol kinase family protein, partial [Lachnospiraceae bacterium]|nr:acylglycerol kinase family protein [Lachnospiraceae bacterium]
MIHIIVNPAGAGGKTLKNFRKSILPLFADSNYEIHFSSKTKGVSEIVSSLTDTAAIGEDSFVNLVIVGGDGTMNDVVNGIRDFEHTRVGLIPAGS